MKKLFLIVLALLTILCFVACDTTDTPADTARPDGTEAATTPADKVTTAEPDDDDDQPSDSKVDKDYRDQLDEILKKNAEKDFEGIALDAKATVGMNIVTSGVTSNNTMSMDLSLVMNKNYEFSGGFSSAYLFDTDEPMTVVFVDGMLYSKNPSGELLKASATEEDILAMLGLDEMPPFSSDPLEMIPEDVWTELPPEAQNAIKNFKPTDLFKEVKLTSNKNDVRVITCTGLNPDSLVIFSASADEEGTDGSPAEEMESVLDLLKNSPFSLSFTVNNHDQIVACKMDMKMDMTDMLGSEDGSDTDKAEITLSMDVSITHNPDTVILAPENADEYTEVALEDMFDMGGSETYPDGDYWGLNGTVTNVYDDGTATISYLTYDDDFNEYYTEITVNVPDEWMDYSRFLIGIEAEIELICHEDGTYTLSWIAECVTSYSDWGTLLSVDTDADGYTYATVLINASDDDGPYVFLVPDGMIEEASSLVGSEVAVEVVLKDDGTYTLISIEPYSW